MRMWVITVDRTHSTHYVAPMLTRHIRSGLLTYSASTTSLDSCSFELGKKILPLNSQNLTTVARHTCSDIQAIIYRSYLALLSRTYAAYTNVHLLTVYCHHSLSTLSLKATLSTYKMCDVSFASSHITLIDERMFI